MESRLRKLAGVFIIAGIFAFATFCNASITDGTIDSTNKYAWSNNAGWVNFGATNGNIHITDSGITGYAWNEIYGWINMAPTNSGVVPDASGAFSGYAWGESTGWINFTGTSVNCSGVFSGSATGDTIGTLTFDCANCSVTSDYRPANCRGGPPPPPPSCGDTLCNGDETCATCPADCGECPAFCGDGLCNGDETCATCEADCGACPAICGDASCNGEETCETCEIDCGECPSPCGNTICDPFETCKTCPIDCGACPAVCGDDLCNRDETCNSCPQDCGECPIFCGDAACNGDETCSTCEADCGKCPSPPPSSCGNKICDVNENCNNCPGDCGECPSPSCGNGNCDPSESCDNCPSDCGECKPPPFAPFCGDDTCGITENCYICPKDCGECELLDTPIPGVVIPPIIPPKIKEVIETPVGSAVTRAIATTGVAITVFTFPFWELFLLPLRLIGILMVAFGWKKRYPPWGTVYDSVTKQPLDPAYVTLFDSIGKEISSAITDLDGRYGFLVDSGTYEMAAKKTNYAFPSRKLAGKTDDELYDNLYFGEPLEINKDQIIMKNIPLDPVKFDWNEFAKKDKRLTRFYSEWNMFFRKISDIMYYIGFFVAVIAFFAAPYPYNLIIVCLYVFFLVLRILGIKPRPFGSVTNISDRMPLQFAILRVFSSDTNNEVSRRVTDKYGRYFCLVPKGRYYVKIERKNSDGSYSLVYTSPVINALKTGIIKERFRVQNKNEL